MDLVFDDISSPIASKVVVISEQRPQAHSSPVSKRSADRNNVEEESLFDLSGFDNNNVALADDDDDNDDVDEDDVDDADFADAETAAAAPEAESQNWLVRSVHRIKRSIDNLLGGPEKTVKPPKKKKKKNPKKPLNGSKKVKIDGDLNAGKKSAKKSQPIERRKGENLKKSTRVEKNKRKPNADALRLKRQFDESAYDDEDRMSGSGGLPDRGFENVCKCSTSGWK